METPHQPFYVVGGTLPADAPSYVVREADAALLEGLRAGDFCYVLDTRQVGKSSLLVRAAVALRQEGVTVAFLDLTQVGRAATPQEWYYGLLVRLADQTGCRDAVRDFWRANPELGPLQRWMEALTAVILPRVPDRLVVQVDEIDFVRTLPFPTDDFFAGVRELHNRRATEDSVRRVTFCLAGTATPQQLISDV